MQFALTFMAGAIGTLSPCVLPVLPIVIGSTRQSGPLGPLMLAMGMLISFTVVGFGVASFGNRIGITQEIISTVSALLMLIFGIVMFSTKLADLLTSMLSRLSNRFAQISAKSDKKTYRGQFSTGVLLGGIWSPCTGPTLWVAISMAAAKQDSVQALILMAAYGLGSAVPLMLVARFSQLFTAKREKIGNVVGVGKSVFAAVLIFVAVLMLTHLDKALEGVILDILPESFLNFLTKF